MDWISGRTLFNLDALLQWEERLLPVRRFTERSSGEHHRNLVIVFAPDRFDMLTVGGEVGIEPAEEAVKVAGTADREREVGGEF